MHTSVLDVMKYVWKNYNGILFDGIVFTWRVLHEIDPVSSDR